MIGKKLGYLLIIFSIVLVIFLTFVASSLRFEAEILGCYELVECKDIDSSLTFTHIIFGFVGFILSLGFYLVFFYRAEEEILNKLRNQKENEFESKKYDIIESILDSFEAKIFNILREQDGIGQSTLVLRSGFSKAKVSEVIKNLEDRKILKKVKKGKYNHIYLSK